MFDTLHYTDVEGKRKDHSLTIYALSTCGFCTRALEFLTAHGIAYRFIYMDLLPIEQKTEVKTALAEHYKVQVSFPYAVIDDRKVLVGFVETDWKEELL